MTEGDTITVWGDNGALCRWYVGTWAVGDTVVWGFNNTDFLGNEITAGFPPDLEQPGDYHISFCGTYWLPYADGLVSGAIAPGITSASLVEFGQVILACSATVVAEQERPEGILVREGSGGTTISLVDPGAGRLRVFDPCGHLVHTRTWSGSPVLLDHFASGVYVIESDVPGGVRRRKVFIR